MLTSDIRRSFLKFFQHHGHELLESSSVTPQNDPSLLFANAGMVQFKNVFLGLETRGYKRAVTAQKCIRAGGKHNDLDQVGFTARHHTFFEMLGNFSFGDYFKEEAIDFAWCFLTKELGLSRDRLLVTVFHLDEVAKQVWEKVAPGVMIIPISTTDNFWSMGDVGPCGPCSEIFYDLGDDVAGGMPGTPEESGDRYMEIWNIVFMQFEQKKNGEREPLGKQSIDTGMGLERIASIMQGKKDNYLIDLFENIMERIKRISATDYENTYPSYKVIADHIRSISFLIADGVVPSNEGRGYVLRRILRRAMRHGSLICIEKPFLFDLSNVLVDVMKDAYPELEKARAVIASTILREEENFLETLERGLKILQADAKTIPFGGILNGEKAFKLYDTYGFPLDLTQDILKSENISVDTAGFEKSLQEQQSRSKWTGSGETKEEEIWHALREKLECAEFCGYEKVEDRSDILVIVQNSVEISSLSAGKAFLVTRSTPFYAECGGQCGDTGLLETSTGVFRVINTLKFCDAVVAHEGELISGNLKIHDEAHLKIDYARRQKIMANHTATHLLQAALRSALGDHVVQRGSSLNENRLRLDFSHGSAISPDNLLKIEAMVNEWIFQNLDVVSKTMPKNDAIAAGAMALFGEKYSDFVRTVRVGNGESFELCGGTHVSATGKIGVFKILSEASIGSGIRRIEALTGRKALEYFEEIEESINKLSEKLKCGKSEVVLKVDDLLGKLKQKNHEISIYKQNFALEKMQVTAKNGLTICSLTVSDFSVDELRSLNDVIRSKDPSAIVIILGQNDDKISLLVSVGKDLQNRYNAGQILKVGLGPLNGNGGGSAALAQGGGTKKSGISSAMECMHDAIYAI
ncbi:MAG: alanine--tRNA ligase [Holosporaceae bacterium]|jgi:alanyl-tRNA synthetase|nr:alanine--tRNA ligase [Holosporaceae bacterium]